MFHCFLFLRMTNPKFLVLFSRFVIGREKPGEQSEVAQLIQQTLEQERWQREMMEQRYKQYMDDDEEVHATPLRRVGGKRTATDIIFEAQLPHQRWLGARRADIAQ